MKKVTIKIDIKGSAFEEIPEQEISRILRKVANKIEGGNTEFKILDVNGNSCGSVKIV